MDKKIAAANRTLADAADQLRAELTQAAAEREAAKAALVTATDRLNDLIYAALTTRKVIPVSTIHKFAGVAPSRVYQIQAQRQAKAAEQG